MKTYNDLVVISEQGAIWVCRCVCGIVVSIPRHRILSNNTKSCGCRKHRTMPRLTHGAKVCGRVSPAYRTWQAMKNRCRNPNAADRKYYGGRGIDYDPHWETYENFIADMGKPPKGHTLERIDNSKGYSKGNCRWATRAEQSRNRDYCLWLEFGGETHRVWEWAELLNVKPATIHHRLWRHKCAPEKFPIDAVFKKKG